MDALKGIDISHYQRNMTIDFSKYDFVIIKATEGVTYNDDMCAKFAKDVEECGVTVGFYHYARPDNNNTPQAEATNFINKLVSMGYYVAGKMVKPALLALDWEGKALQYDCEWAKIWCEFIKQRTGIKPFIYFSSSNTKKIYDKLKDVAYFWIANWSRKPEKITELESMGVNCAWQYNGRILDEDIFYGNLNELIAIARGDEIYNEETENKKAISNINSAIKLLSEAISLLNKKED